MTTLQAFLLGIMVAWTPALLVLGWYLLKNRIGNRLEHHNSKWHPNK